MNGKSDSIPIEHEWVNPDDAPELTDEFFEKATPMIGERVVTFEEFVLAAEKAMSSRGSAQSKVSATIDYDADILEAFKATGDGWEARMNDALRDWMKIHLA